MITGAHDKTIRLWDIRKPSTMATLTYHKKSVRALAMHPTECGPPACSCLGTTHSPETQPSSFLLSSFLLAASWKHRGLHAVPTYKP